MLPAAVTYDLLLSPLVLILVVTAVRGAPEPGTAGYAAATVVLATPAAVRRAPAVFRPADAAIGAMPGSVTRLSFAGTRPAAVRAPARPDPKLRFGSGNGPSSSRTGSQSLRAAHPGRQGAGSWSGGSAGGPRGSGWLRDARTQRGAARLGAPSHGTGMQRGPARRPPKVAFGGRRDGLIGGSVLANGNSGFSFRSSGGFSGALGPSLFAGGDTRRGRAVRGRAFLGGPRGATFRGAGPANGGLGNSALRGGTHRGSAPRGSAPGAVLQGQCPRGSAFRGSVFSGQCVQGQCVQGQCVPRERCQERDARQQRARRPGRQEHRDWRSRLPR